MIDFKLGVQEMERYGSRSLTQMRSMSIVLSRISPLFCIERKANGVYRIAQLVDDDTAMNEEVSHVQFLVY